MRAPAGAHRSTLAQRLPGPPSSVDPSSSIALGRVEAQNVGAESGECPARDRTGDHSGQVEDAHPGGGELTGRERAQRRRLRGTLVEVEQPEAGDSAPLRMCVPCGGVAERRRAAAGGEDRVLELLAAPPCRGGPHGVEVGVRDAERREQGRAVVGVVRVRAQPSIRRPQPRRQRRESRADRLSVEPEMALGGE